MLYPFVAPPSTPAPSMTYIFPNRKEETEQNRTEQSSTYQREWKRTEWNRVEQNRKVKMRETYWR